MLLYSFPRRAQAALYLLRILYKYSNPSHRKLPLIREWKYFTNTFSSSSSAQFDVHEQHDPYDPYAYVGHNGEFSDNGAQSVSLNIYFLD